MHVTQLVSVNFQNLSRFAWPASLTHPHPWADTVYQQVDAVDPRAESLDPRVDIADPSKLQVAAADPSRQPYKEEEKFSALSTLSTHCLLRMLAV